MTLQPKTGTFALLSFEGPDVYSQAGGLGVRVKELARALAEAGFETHLYFVGAPDLPGEETLVDGRLTYHRWCQWLSDRYRGGVYHGEEEKIRDWNQSLPGHLVNRVLVPAAEAGRALVVLGEEWHTTWSMNLISDALYYRGLRDRIVMLWNANNLFGFHRINWSTLCFAATVTTVSRYMKHRMWSEGVNPIVIPNGIPSDSIRDPAPEDVAALRQAAAADLFLFKIGRFDPDKRWLVAVSAAGHLKRQGLGVRLLIRGGQEPHGHEVLAHAQYVGLQVDSVEAPGDVAGLAALLREHRQADVINLTTFVPTGMLGPLYASADAVLANSGHEPFGLVGLEVMAAGGLAVTGSTGEDYAEPYRNALVLETEDPLELVTGLRILRERPRMAERIRREGRRTAGDYVWEKVIDQLLFRIELAGAQQSVRFPEADSPRRVARAAPRRRPAPAPARVRPPRRLPPGDAVG